MNVLLTGATGFLGSHLLRALLHEGYQVTLLKRSSSNCKRVEQELGQCRIYDVDCVPIDIVFQENLIDAVIHCAVAYKKTNRVTDILETNLLFAMRILETAIDANCPYFINTDSFFTKQLPDRLFQSRELYSPEYTLSKYQFREWGRLQAIEGKINFINLQMEHIYGPDDGEGKFIIHLIQSMKNRTPKLDLTDGIQIRDFIYVDDAVTAYLVILNHIIDFLGYSHFEVGSGISCSLKEFVKGIHKESGTSTKLNFGRIPRKGSEIMFSTADITDIKKVGFTPKVSMVEGIQRTVRYI